MFRSMNAHSPFVPRMVMSTVIINAAATITVGKVPRQWIDRRIRDSKRFLHRCQWIRHDVCAIVVLLLGCEPDPLCLTVAR